MTTVCYALHALPISSSPVRRVGTCRVCRERSGPGVRPVSSSRCDGYMAGCSRSASSSSSLRRPTICRCARQCARPQPIGHARPARWVVLASDPQAALLALSTGGLGTRRYSAIRQPACRDSPGATGGQCRSGEADVQDEMPEPQVQYSATGPVDDECQQDDGQNDDHHPKEEDDDAGDGIPRYSSRSSHGRELPSSVRLIRLRDQRQATIFRTIEPSLRRSGGRRCRIDSVGRLRRKRRAQDRALRLFLARFGDR